MSMSRNRRILFAVLAAVASLAVIVPALVGLVSSIGISRDKQQAASVTPTSTKPVITIKPLPVRPVISAYVTTPDQCPPPGAPPADQPARICDIPGTAVYELGPEAMQLELVNADSFRNPLTNAEVVQMSMTPESSSAFQQFTSGQVGKQVAFVRAGTVVWGPRITAPIDGEVLQLTGNISSDQAKEIVRVIKDQT
jgi:hypothetical protein